MVHALSESMRAARQVPIGKNVAPPLLLEGGKGSTMAAKQQSAIAMADALYAAALNAILRNAIKYPTPTDATRCVLLLEVAHDMLGKYIPSIMPDPDKWAAFLEAAAASPEVEAEFGAMLRSLAESDTTFACLNKRAERVYQEAMGPVPIGAGLDMGMMGELGALLAVVRAAFGDGSQGMVILPFAAWFAVFCSRIVLVDWSNGVGRTQLIELAKELPALALLGFALYNTLLVGQAETPFWDGVRVDLAFITQQTSLDDPFLKWHPTSTQIRRALNELGFLPGGDMALVNILGGNACGNTDWSPTQVKMRLGEVFEKNQNALGGPLYSECKGLVERFPGFVSVISPFESATNDINFQAYNAGLVEQIQAAVEDPASFQMYETRAGWLRAMAAVYSLLLFSATRRRANVGEAFDALSVVDHVFARLPANGHTN